VLSTANKAIIFKIDKGRNIAFVKKSPNKCVQYSK
jgi:hypothetical protein